MMKRPPVVMLMCVLVLKESSVQSRDTVWAGFLSDASSPPVYNNL